MAAPGFWTMMHAVRRGVRLRRRVAGPLRPSWSEELETWAMLLQQYARVSGILPLSMQRSGVDAIAPRSPALRAAAREAVDVGGVAGEWIRPPAADPRTALLYLHGGGYALGSIASHRDLVARLATSAGMHALVIEYRLAPEHRFPAQLEDAAHAYRWLLARGLDPARMAIAGDSAGGGLTLSTLVALRDAGDPLPAAAVCFSPWVDLEARGGSMQRNARYDYVSRRALLRYARRFVGHGDMRHPLAAPLHADLAGLPPLLLQAGGAETLLDDSVRIADRARAAGVDVELDVTPDMIHVFQMFGRLCEESPRALGRAGDFLRRLTSCR